jgi:TPR repeat protein
MHACVYTCMYIFMMDTHKHECRAYRNAYDIHDMSRYRQSMHPPSEDLCWWQVGAQRDAKEALEWYMKAAAQGDAKAQFAAGVCYEIGQVCCP